MMHVQPKLKIPHSSLIGANRGSDQRIKVSSGHLLAMQVQEHALYVLYACSILGNRLCIQNAAGCLDWQSACQACWWTAPALLPCSNTALAVQQHSCMVCAGLAKLGPWLSTLVEDSTAASGVPACLACSGMMLPGMEPLILLLSDCLCSKCCGVTGSFAGPPAFLLNVMYIT